MSNDDEIPDGDPSSQLADADTGSRPAVLILGALHDGRLQK
jgi:hypothetical protein